MSDNVGIENILSDSRKLRDMFQNLVEPHRHVLWHYCLRLTGSPWDAEDLFQETLMKAFATLPQLWSPFVPKSYLFRIATNAWIDLCRKNKVVLDVLEDETTAAQHTPDPLEVREAIEHLVRGLPPRQMVILLLMDVFQFGANDVATMLHCTPGSVYAALRRARQRLRALQLQESTGGSGMASGTVQQKAIRPRNRVVEQVIHALNTGDVDAFLSVMSEFIHNDAAPGFQEFSKQEVKKQSGQGLATGLHAAYYELWGREVIVVLADTEGGLALHNVAYPVVEGTVLTYMRGYYFCSELLHEVAQQIGVPVQKDKFPENWDRL